MAEPDYSSASWDQYEGPGSRGAGLTAPLLPPDAQLQHHYNYRPPPVVPSSHPAMSPLYGMSNTHSHWQERSLIPPTGARHQYYRPHMQPPYQFAGGPELMPAIFNGFGQRHSDLPGWSDDGNTVRGAQYLTSSSTPGHSHQGFGSPNTGQSPFAQQQYDSRLTASSAVRGSHAEDVRVSRADTPVSAEIRSQELRPAPQEQRQHSGQLHHNARPFGSWALSEVHGHYSNRSISPRTSNRRNFERYSIDLSRSSTSSDAEEAAARAPPSNRARHRPREVRPRFWGHRAHFDPNVATPRQIQELKDSLPRRLPNELPDETSKACDICQKDYSTTHVQPAEEEEIAIELSCGHVFGEFCIFQWFNTCKTHKNKVTCPMCRKQLIEPSRHHQAMFYALARSGQAYTDLLANELQGDLIRM